MGKRKNQSAAASSSSKSKKKRSSSSSDTSNMFSKSSSKKKKSSAGGSSSSTSSNNNINENSADKLFKEIADEDDTSIVSMEGIFQLGEKLGMDATEDIRILVLLWKMGCNDKPSEINKTEWMQGCSSLNVDTWDKMKKLIPTLDTGFLDQSEFKDFYKFCFQFNRQGTHRTLDKDLVIALLKLVFKNDENRIPAGRLSTFCDFVEGNTGYSRITLDQWTSFLDFCYEVDDLSNYDESTSAWPVLVDEYVEYMEEQSKKQDKMQTG